MKETIKHGIAFFKAILKFGKIQRDTFESETKKKTKSVLKIKDVINLKLDRSPRIHFVDDFYDLWEESKDEQIKFGEEKNTINFLLTKNMTLNRIIKETNSKPVEADRFWAKLCALIMKNDLKDFAIFNVWFPKLEKGKVVVASKNMNGDIVLRAYPFDGLRQYGINSVFYINKE